MDFDRKHLLPPLIAAAACAAFCPAAQAGDALLEGFKTPPPAAQPRVWWQWMGGNVTEQGVRLDLEWMKRVGIGGVQQFDAELDAPFETPRVVDTPLVYRSAEWRRALRYSVELADALGLEFTLASSPGWSVTGGPWVAPHQAMKKLVWSETHIDGGAPFKGRLAKPPRVSGPFQNIPLIGLGALPVAETPIYYADVATLAYRAPAAERSTASFRPRVTSSAGAIDAASLFDADLAHGVELAYGEGERAWIQFSFAQPRRIQAATLVAGRPLGWDPLRESGPRSWLEASDDGAAFRKVADLPSSGALQQTLSFPPVTARLFRVVFVRPRATLLEQYGIAAPRTAHRIAQLVLHTEPRVNRFEDKAGFSTRLIVEADDTPPVAADDAVAAQDIVDLTNRLRPDGSLEWTPPRGRWVVLRLGYSLTGRVNGPAPRAGRGLEVDKLNRDHVRSYIDAYLGAYEQTLGADRVGRRGLQYLLTDSYEHGPQNWTEDMAAQFRQRRGYDLLPWLAVPTGRVIGSAEASDRFLWDFRQTLSELMTEAHYGEISRALRERGMGLYTESHERGRAFIGDGMAVKRAADIPMGAMPAAAPGETQTAGDADLRESASTAHIYGKNIVAAESFTAPVLDNPYAFTPEMLKPTADRMLAHGVNRFIIHTSVHQPTQAPGPGIGLFINGQWFTRKETWAEQAGPWVMYLARSSYLLQQGRPVADVAYLYGEDSNITALFGERLPPIPEGFNFDFINAEALLDELSVRNGQLTTASGMAYRVLALDASTRRMSLPVLRKIRDLVKAGATVVGAKPERTPSLADNEEEFRTIVAQLWGEGSGEQALGAGKVFADRSLGEALRAMQIAPDVSFTGAPGGPVRFLHRALEDGELYFVSSGAAHPYTLEASFRVSGMQPELWRADTGEIAPLSYRMERGRTAVSLRLEPNDAVFVVFRVPTSAQSAAIRQPRGEMLAVLEGPWDIRFPPGLGAPARARLERLSSWTDSAEAGIQYFSGTATYSRTLPVRGAWLEHRSRVWLDLGQVKNVAAVFVNGRSVGVLWKAPFVLDMTDALTAGDNRLEIEVTNLWPNRLIGDKQPGARKIAFAAFDPFKADSPLLPSGLLGPVKVFRSFTPRIDTPRLQQAGP